MLSFSVVLMNCASSNFTTTNDTKYPEFKGAVKVFFNEVEDLEYIQVGIISAEGTLFGDDVEMIKTLQKKAAKNGANAIIIMSAFSGTKIKTQEKGEGILFSGNDERKMLAVAIRINS